MQPALDFPLVGFFLLPQQIAWLGDNSKGGARDLVISAFNIYLPRRDLKSPSRSNFVTKLSSSVTEPPFTRHFSKSLRTI